VVRYLINIANCDLKRIGHAVAKCDRFRRQRI
jgi:hypothetical protein